MIEITLLDNEGKPFNTAGVIGEIKVIKKGVEIKHDLHSIIEGNVITLTKRGKRRKLK